MNKVTSFAVAALFAVCGFTVVGCQSTTASQSPPMNGAYAGGTGVFGEDPVNPGEHSGDRFRAAIQASSHTPSTTQPNG